MGRYYEKRLQKFVDRGAMSEEAKNWFISATDPFHDTQIKPSGYPDNNVDSTIVQCIKKSFSVQCPASVTSGTWDTNITLLPNLYGGIAAPAAGTIGNFRYSNALGRDSISNANQSACPVLLGGCVANSVATGNSTWAKGSGGFDAITSVGVDASQYGIGRYRVVGMGFEVHNTTAPLYKQGIVTVYNQPAQVQESSASVEIGTTAGQNIGSVTTVLTQQPPQYVTNAMLLPGSKQWAAELGNYNVSRYNNIDNPLKEPRQVFLGYRTEDVSTGQVYTTRSLLLQDVASVTASGSTVVPYAWDRFSPFDISGAFYSGLSLQTTLQVEVRWYIERCPTVREFDLVVLATPSTCYDAMAMELYSKAMCELPPGVPVGENPLGEWFNKVMSALETVATPIGNALGTVLPGAQYIGQGVTKIAQNLRERNQKAQAEEDKKNKPKMIKAPASKPSAKKK